MKSSHKAFPVLVLFCLSLLAGCSAQPVPSQPAQSTALPEQPSQTVPASATPVPPSPTLPPTQAATATRTATPLPSTRTPTVNTPTPSRTATRTPEPTFAFYNRTFKAPAAGARLLSFDESGLWLAAPHDYLYRLDRKTGKVLSTQRFGCTVCFGPCDFFAAARDGAFFWSLQYGGIGEQNCTADNPWSSLGVMFRRIKAGSEASEYINLSSLFNAGQSPQTSALLVVDGKIWLAQDQAIFIIDASKSREEKPAIIKTIFPGIFVEGLLYAENQVWAAGDALLSINPSTYQVSGVYPLSAQILAYDGQSMWGANKYGYTIQSITLGTRLLSEPILLPEYPSALGFDGSAIWIAFENTRDLAVIPVR